MNILEKDKETIKKIIHGKKTYWFYLLYLIDYILSQVRTCSCTLHFQTNFLEACSNKSNQHFCLRLKQICHALIDFFSNEN